jgi:hypothetical protein
MLIWSRRLFVTLFFILIFVFYIFIAVEVSAKVKWLPSMLGEPFSLVIFFVAVHFLSYYNVRFKFKILIITISTASSQINIK